MARVGGRNAFLAWTVGLGCAAVVGVLAVLALPMVPASLGWIDETVNPPAATGEAVAAAADGAAEGPPATCDGLYDEALWATLRFTEGAVMTPSTDAPTTTATALVAALQPQVTVTCTWHSDLGEVTSTIATVPTDAGAIAAAALPAAGFACAAEGERTRCTRTDGDLAETIEAGGGLWLSTSESAWHPAEYVRRTADRVWG